MKITYIKNGDYYLPNLKLTNNKIYIFNKYSYLKLDYIKNHKKSLYQELLISDELSNYLYSVGTAVEEQVDLIIEQMIMNDDELTEKLKINNQLLWVQKMNEYKIIAEEQVMNELIYN